MSWFSTRKQLHARIRDLEEENEGLADSVIEMREYHKREHERQCKRIDALTQERDTIRNHFSLAERKIAALQLAATNTAAHIGMLRAERDKATAEVKRLHQLISKLDVDNLKLGAALETAREEIAGLKLAVTS